MLPKSLLNAGKTALIILGAGFGLLRSLRIIGNVMQNSAALDTLEARVDTIHIAVARLAGQTEEIQLRLEQTATKEELTHALDVAFGKMERGVDARFEHHTRSVEALRTMVGQTDELLQRVLDGLESLKAESEEFSRS